MTKLILTIFFFNTKSSQDVKGWVGTKIVESEGPQVYQVVPALNRQGILYGFFNTLAILALELGSSLYYTKQEIRG